jgi:hypothetical protein
MQRPAPCLLCTPVSCQITWGRATKHDNLGQGKSRLMSSSLGPCCLPVLPRGRPDSSPTWMSICFSLKQVRQQVSLSCTSWTLSSGTVALVLAAGQVDTACEWAVTVQVRTNPDHQHLPSDQQTTKTLPGVVAGPPGLQVC